MPAPTSSVIDRWTLSWSPSPPPAAVLPPNITRSFITTPSGPIELLSAKPTPNPGSKPKPPILFMHGGFGCAEVYLNFLSYFASHSYPVYAVSVRGHGHSWTPSFLRMVYLTTATAFTTDVAAALHHVQTLHSRPAILAAHSYGGGLVQKLLNTGTVTCAALILLCATPNYGGLRVYASWASLDPWFVLRLYFRDRGHSRSPLSSTSLVHGAFFSPGFPRALVRAHELLMQEYESILWPLRFMWRFVDAERVYTAAQGRILVVAAELDRLMPVPLMLRMAAEYREVEERKVGKAGGKGDVGFREVKGVAHHLMNEETWEDAARVIEEWVEEREWD